MTLEADNLHWLQGQAAAAKARGISELLDRLVTDARRTGQVDAGAIRSVAGTIDVHPDDPDLERADAAIRAMFTSSLGRPLLAREAPPVRRARKGGRRG